MSKQSLRALLDWYQHFAGLIHETRFSLITVAIAGLAFIVNDQAKDLLQGIDVNSATGMRYIIMLVLGVGWCALQGWGWARYVLDPARASANPPPPLKDSTRRKLTLGFALLLIVAALYLRHIAVLALLYLPWTFKDPVQYLPRFYGVLAYMLAIIAAVHADQFIVIGLLAASLALFLVFTHHRRKSARLAWLAHISKGKWTAVTLAICAALMAWSIGCAVNMGWALGAGAVVFFGLGAIIPVGSLIVIWMRKTHIPAISLLLVFIIAISSFTDNHAVRTLDKPAQRITSLGHAYQQWQQLNTASSAEQEAPLVLVATAGGGLRAAYWTALTLGELERKSPGFHQRVFAISGVSGGSVGAMFYVAALDAEKNDADKSNPLATTTLYDTVGEDFLAPTISSMLFGDLLQRFVPVIGSFAIPDRAQALEKSWEDQFRDRFSNAASANDKMQDAFTTFWNNTSSDNWLPLLFINGTHEETGQRIITTPVTMDRQIFTDALDFFALNGGHDIRASTAAHNSARFSYVSPAGTLVDGDTVKGHIIDGGYFENNGAETLLEIYGALKKKQKNIIVIAITNDVEMPNEVYDDTADPAIKIDRHIVKPASFLNEAAAPPKGLLSTREARGMLAFKRLRDAVCKGASNCDSFYHFNIQKTINNDLYQLARSDDLLKAKFGKKQHCVNPPLGWVLSPAARRNMNYQLGIEPGQPTDFDLGDCFTPASTADNNAMPRTYHNNAALLQKIEARLAKTVAIAPP